MKGLVLIAIAATCLAMSSQAAFAQSDINFTKMMNYDVPAEIGGLIGDARVNIYDYEDNRLGSVILFNASIGATSDQFLENPTHNVYVKDGSVLQKIFDADSPAKEFNRQRSLHNIRIEAVGLFDQIKLALATAAFSIISLFIAPE